MIGVLLGLRGARPGWLMRVAVMVAGFGWLAFLSTPVAGLGTYFAGSGLLAVAAMLFAVSRGDFDRAVQRLSGASDDTLVNAASKDRPLRLGSYDVAGVSAVPDGLFFDVGDGVGSGPGFVHASGPAVPPGMWSLGGSWYVGEPLVAEVDVAG